MWQFLIGWMTGLALFSAPLAHAFPDKPTHIVVPFAPGGGTVIGADAVAKSLADGYSLVMATFANAVNLSVLPKLPYNYAQAFAPHLFQSRNNSLAQGDSKRQN